MWIHIASWSCIGMRIVLWSCWRYTALISTIDCVTVFYHLKKIQFTPPTQEKIQDLFIYEAHAVMNDSFVRTCNIHWLVQIVQDMDSLTNKTAFCILKTHNRKTMPLKIAFLKCKIDVQMKMMVCILNLKHHNASLALVHHCSPTHKWLTLHTVDTPV